MLELEARLNIVSCVYNKDAGDPTDLEVEDKGFVRNVFYTPAITTPPPPVFVPTPVATDASGGGSFGWIMLCLLGVVFSKTRTNNK